MPRLVPGAPNLLVADQNALLGEIRGVTARYHRVDVALAEGYTFITPCLYSGAGLGGRGHVYRNTTLLDGVLDPLEPEILMYEPQKNGELRLVAVHYTVLAASWEAANPGVWPMLGTEPLRDRRAPGAAPLPSYSIFVALWRHNPSGMYADFNPAVSCEHAVVAVPQ